jgi:hypothetical protein
MVTPKSRLRLLAACAAALALCFISASLLAEHGRNFAGEFQVRKVVDEGSVFHFDLHVQVFNFSGADVKDATLTLADRRPGANPDAIDYQGSFREVSIAYRKSIVLDGSFTVPVREYHAWQHGAAPYLAVTYRDEAGNERRSPVELKPAIGGGLPKGGLQ